MATRSRRVAGRRLPHPQLREPSRRNVQFLCAMATVLSVLQPIHPVPGIGGLELAGVVTQSVRETSGFPPLPSPVPLDPPDPPVTFNVAAGSSTPLPSLIDSDGAATHAAEISSIPPTVAGAKFSGSHVDPAPRSASWRPYGGRQPSIVDTYRCGRRSLPRLSRSRHICRTEHDRRLMRWAPGVFHPAIAKPDDAHRTVGC